MLLLLPVLPPFDFVVDDVDPLVLDEPTNAGWDVADRVLLVDVW